MILTVQRELLYNGEKLIDTPIGKGSPWAVLRLSHYPRFAQEHNGTACANSSTLALRSGLSGWRNSYPSRNPPERRAPRQYGTCARTSPAA